MIHSPFRKAKLTILKKSLVLCAAGLALGCATAGKMAGKAAWFVLDTSVRLTGATIHGLSRVAGMETKHAIDLTADAATKLWAETESKKIVERFWDLARKGSYESCHALLSDEVRKKVPLKQFAREADKWSGRIDDVQILQGTVLPDHVEVPTRVSSAKTAASIVRLYVSPIGNVWKILYWTVNAP